MERKGRKGGKNGKGLWSKEKNGQDFISQPHLPPTDTTFPFPPFPELNYKHTHTACPRVHSLPKLRQMSHQDFFGHCADEEFEKFWKIFVERLRIEVAEAW